MWSTRSTSSGDRRNALLEDDGMTTTMTRWRGTVGDADDADDADDAALAGPPQQGKQREEMRPEV